MPPAPRPPAPRCCRLRYAPERRTTVGRPSCSDQGYSPTLHHAPVDAPRVDRDRQRDQADGPPAQPVAGKAERDQDDGERGEIVAEAVAELDPALAEMHQV